MSVRLTAASSQYISYAVSTDFDDFTAMTVECWVKFSSLGSNRDILSKWRFSGAGFGWILLYSNSSGGIRWEVTYDSGTAEDVVQTSFVPPLNKWVHIMATWATDERNVYINGELAGTENANTRTSIRNTTYDIKVGTQDDVGNYLDGTISQVRIWEDTLTPAQIYSLYKGADPYSISPTNLRFYAPLPSTSDYDDDIGPYTGTASGSPTNGTEEPLTVADASYTSTNTVPLPAYMYAGDQPESFYLDMAASDSRIQTDTDGVGAASNTDGELQLNAGATGSAIAYNGTQLDTSKNQLHYFWFSRTGTATTGDIMRIFSKSTAPVCDTQSNIDAQTQILLEHTSATALRISYNDGVNTNYWQEVTPQWQTTAANSHTAWSKDNYFGCIFEIDADNARWRILLIGNTYDASNLDQQGHLLITITEWVNLSSLEDPTNLWIGWGHAYTDVNNDATTAIERYEYTTGKRVYGSLNAALMGDPFPPDYSQRVFYAYGVADGLPRSVPDGDSVSAITGIQSGGTPDAVWVKDFWELVFDGEVRTFYNGRNASNVNTICLATDGTKYGSNPIIPVPSGQTRIQFPCVIYEDGALHLYADCEDASSNFSIWYFTTTDLTGQTGWSAGVEVLSESGITGSFYVDGVAQAVVRKMHDGTYECIFGGYVSGSFRRWRIGRATFPSHGSAMTAEPLPLIDVNHPNSSSNSMAWSSVSGRTITLASSADGRLEAEDFVFVRDTATQDEAYTRIKDVSGTDVEVYTELAGFGSPDEVQTPNNIAIAPRQLIRAKNKLVLITTGFFSGLGPKGEGNCVYELYNVRDGGDSQNWELAREMSPVHPATFLHDASVPDLSYENMNFQTEVNVIQAGPRSGFTMFQLPGVV